MEELTQILIRELQEYIQKVAGESGYIDPSEIWIPVDHPSFGDNARKYRLSSIIGTSANKQKGRISNLTSNTVTVTWDMAFSERPIGFHRVYREVIEGSNKRMEDVILDSESVTTNNMVLTINSDESLTGVIVEYNYE